MARAVRHISLHRIAGTELRVVADVETGVLPIVEVEETVIHAYARQSSWPHRWVTLFILQDLSPLVRQLQPDVKLPPEGTTAPQNLPIVNVYDLADPANCHVFANRDALAKAGYWDDMLAIRGLLAHEHAHPLAENPATRASRELELKVSLRSSLSDAQATDLEGRMLHLLTALAEKLCLRAPREIFANEVTLAAGFGDALLHLDRRNAANASRNVAGREDLRQQLNQGIRRRAFTKAAASALLLIGDMQAYLDLALETASFYRAGRRNDAHQLKETLETEVFPHLDVQLPRAYAGLLEQYLALQANMTTLQLMAWGKAVLETLAHGLADKGVIIGFDLQPTDKCDA